MSNTNSYVIAISGSRDYTDILTIYNALRSELSKTNLKPILVHGGCRGADTLAEQCFRELVKHPHVIVHKADWAKYGIKAGPLRNAKIIDGADVLLAFPLPQSRGTLNTIKLARERGIRVRIIGNN